MKIIRTSLHYISLVVLEQCQSEGACLVVTVLDHDILSTDDFEGEAFLGLRAIPGVGEGKEADGVDATPAQIRLPLMHPKPNGMNQAGPDGARRYITQL